MAMRLLSFAIWAAVAASAVFWLTRLLARSDAAPSHTITASTSPSVAAADFSRLLGSTRNAPTEPRTEPVVDARFKLVGVVATKTTTPDSGLALIAIDGKPPRPVGLGGVVDGSLVLLAVNHRRAELGPAGGEATVRLELPAVPEANRSVRAPGSTVPIVALPAQPAPPPSPALPQPNVGGSAPASPVGRPAPAVSR
jgi:general secretion pathway protein C